MCEEQSLVFSKLPRALQSHTMQPTFAYQRKTTNLKRGEKFGKFGIFSKLSKLPRSTMSVGKFGRHAPALATLVHSPLPNYSKGKQKTMIGQLNLCRMKLPYRQRHQERASRVCRDHKLALRTAFAAILLVTTSVVSAAETPEVRRTAITRERLCWNDHADKSEKEGTFQRKYCMKRRTFKKLVALLRPALERD